MAPTRTLAGLLLATTVLLARAGVAQTPKTYPVPPVTTWAPQGCRGVPASGPAIPINTAWHNLHGDLVNSDELEVALAPEFRESWTAEAATFNVTGPVFDAAGNLYFAPLFPHENVVLISIEPRTGARRWAIAGTGAPPGASAPLVLPDPDHPGAEIVYLALYDRVLAVHTDGSIVWDVPSGLTLPPDRLHGTVLGTNYAPGVDAIFGVARDGKVFGVDRRTGAPVLTAPFQIPGAPTPPGTPIALPPATIAAAEDLLQVLADVPDGTLQDLIDVLLGNATKVANHFGVDPHTDQLWVAATAPDGEDGVVDGVSQLGALYRLALVPNGSRRDVVEVCHRSFAGGSASTPTLRADGARVYLGDNFGKLIAVDADCSDAWELDLGAQILGSVVVSVDRGEIYCATRAFVAKVVDRGASGELEWTATIDPFENLAGGQQNFNLNLVTAGANGLAFQGGAGLVLNGTPLPAAVGVGILDRETGTIRYFASGGEETVAVMSVGPDGAMYIGNSPVRRLFAQVLGLSPAPIRGGITKFEPIRSDLLLRDAACAGAARGANADLERLSCEASARADADQLRVLIAQGRAAASAAGAVGDYPPNRVLHVDRRLARADARLADAASSPLPTVLRRGLHRATGVLRRICRSFE